MDYKPLLEQLLAALKMSKKKFAESIGASQGNVSGWFNRENVKPSIDVLKRISDIHNVNLNWLITGEGEMFRELIPLDPGILSQTIRLPIVAEIAAGQPCEAILDEPLGFIEIPRALLIFAPPYLVFRVSGRSMEPHILNGDVVICSQDWQGIDTDGKIMAFRTWEGITLKKLVEDHKNRVTWLMPINHEFTPVPYTEDSEEITMIGILDIAIRSFNRE